LRAATIAKAYAVQAKMIGIYLLDSSVANAGTISSLQQKKGRSKEQPFI
jgi:hypothetical protein